jgi:hypothetical protein
MTDNQTPPGHGRRFCGANKRQGKGQCTHPAGWGTDHPGYGSCKLHGGSTPNGITSAEREHTKHEVGKALAGITDFTAVTNSLEALTLLAGRAQRWMEKLGGIVTELDSLRYSTDTEQIDGRVVLYERAMQLTGKLLTDIARLDLDARLVNIEQRKADMMATALGQALAELGLPVETQNSAKVGFVRRLRVAASA